MTPVDQVIVVRLTADTPGRVSFSAQLRGERNDAHSNYATDYFRMDGYGTDGLIVRGKSADYLGVPGKLRYQSRLRALPRGGDIQVVDDDLVVSNADEVVLVVAAATNFVSYKDVSADPDARVERVMKAARGQDVRRVESGARRRAPAPVPARGAAPRRDRGLRCCRPTSA